MASPLLPGTVVGVSTELDVLRRSVLVRAVRDGDVTTAREVAQSLPDESRRPVLAWAGTVQDLVSLDFDGVSPAIRMHTGIDAGAADRLSRACATYGYRTGRLGTLAALADRAEADGRFLDAFSAWSAAAEVLPVIWALEHVSASTLRDERIRHGDVRQRDPWRLARSDGWDTTERAAALAACALVRCSECQGMAADLEERLSVLYSRRGRAGAELALSLRYGDPGGLRRLRNSLVHEDVTDYTNFQSSLKATAAALVRRGAPEPRSEEVTLALLVRMVYERLSGDELLDPLDFVACEVDRILQPPVS